MNHVLFGDVLIDLEDLWFARIDGGKETFGETPHTRVMSKRGQAEGLEGKEKAAFDAWARGLPKAGHCGKCGESLTEYLTDGLGRRLQKFTLSVAVESCEDPGEAIMCLACAGFDVVVKEPGAPPCEVIRPDADPPPLLAQAFAANEHPNCAECIRWNIASSYCRTDRMSAYPECFEARAPGRVKPRQQGRAP